MEHAFHSDLDLRQMYFSQSALCIASSLSLQHGGCKMPTSCYLFDVIDTDGTIKQVDEVVLSDTTAVLDTELARLAAASTALAIVSE